MIINPNVKLTQLSVGKTWAVLEAKYYQNMRYEFLVNPEEVSWNHQSNFKDLPVLYTGQPQLAYQNSQSSLSLPNVLLWTPGFSGSLKDAISVLTRMTKPTQDNKPPLLSLTWGNMVQPMLYLKNFSLKEQQWRSGTCTQASASLDFLIVPEAVASQKTETLPNLSDRECKEYEEQITNLLNKDKNRAKNLGINPDTGVKVSSDGGVFYKDERVFSLKDKFSDVLKASHRNL